MIKYIPADKLTKKFEKMIDDIPASVDSGAGYVIDEVYKIIDSLQQEQPEVELEKEIDRFWDSCIKHKNERGGNVIWSNKLEVEVLARHFFELGINARKEE